MSNKPENEIKKENTEQVVSEKPKCGIVMPISALDTCSAEHWSEVLSILRDAINQAGFEPNLVSNADDSGIIQKRIIQNLYSNEIVICDVSAKNPNVMFELGIRLAFDKPTIIVKDDKTDYSFDTQVIEHITYPRELRFPKIVLFKDALTKKIKGTYEKSTKDKNYTTFLKNFGEYKVAQLSEKEVSSDKYILNAIKDLQKEFKSIRNVVSDEMRIRPHLIEEFTMSLDRIFERLLHSPMGEELLMKSRKEFDHLIMIWEEIIMSSGMPREIFMDFREKWRMITRKMM